MSNASRVVWDEGMMLAPQHFQQWERWIAAELRDRGQAGQTHGFGFTSLELDPGALTGGQLAITHCAGFFADGTAFASPTRDALPAPRAVAAALDGRPDGALAYLALPKAVAGTSTYGDAGGTTPLVRQRQRVVDLARPEADREIATARLNLSVRIDGDDLTAYHTLPIARLLRAPTGGVAFAADFSPPSLTVRTSTLLVSVLRQVTGMLAQKWTELSGKRRGGGGMADAAGLLLLHTAGENLPGLRHCLEHGATRPEFAYLLLARLAAQMCSFHEKHAPTEIPAYDHENPGPCFRQLGDLLKELLGEAAPSQCDSLPLEREGESLFTTRIPSPNMLTHGRLFLAVRADATEDQIQSSFPTLVKIAAKDRLQDLLMRAIPGLPIRHVAQPPAAIPTQVGRTYFRLEPSGEHWDAIVASLTLAIHVSPGLPQLGLELLAVKQ